MNEISSFCVVFEGGQTVAYLVDFLSTESFAVAKIAPRIAQILQNFLNSLIVTFLDEDKTETGQSLFILMDFLSKSINNQHTIVNSETYKIK
ncbi:CLN_G0001010.mRNA.1.CDS.1 [Saccharomyces cerevisiae]|nr:CLN_G0001010.mRNA.1.CDS.1 [Saccharomyces cerevisiae]CAI7130367.1 CLN_G0001010.mRNA.1.CDS.1 [Saccharomyces cerevisiae]